MKILNSFGKFGSLVITHNGGAGSDTNDRNTAGTRNSSCTSAEVAEFRPANPLRARMGRPSSAIGPFAGKIGFRKGL